MTTAHHELTLLAPGRTGTREERAGEDGVWLPVITVPVTFALCVAMFFVLHVG